MAGSGEGAGCLPHLPACSLLQDELVFHLGDYFDSLDALKARLAAHSKLSSVHYWLRDSRTAGAGLAKSATAKHISPRIKYYSLRYACVYGGQKFSPKGTKKNTKSLRSNCPSHISFKANRSGLRLYVVSVCNHHNHPISKDIFQRLPQERRLPPALKEEVVQFLKLSLPKKRLMSYIKVQSGKTVTYKDILNLGQLVKGSESPSPQRTEALYEIWRNFESQHPCPERDNAKAETAGCIAGWSKVSTRQRVSRKRKQPTGNVQAGPKRKRPARVKKEKPKKHLALTKFEPVLAEQLVPVGEECDVDVEGCEELDTAVDREVEIHCVEYPDNIAHSDILGYLYQTDCEGEPILILNDDDGMVCLEPSEGDVINEDLIISPKEISNDLTVVNFDQDMEDLGKLTEPRDVAIEEIQQDNIEEVLVKSEEIFEETWIFDDNLLRDSEIVISEFGNEVSVFSEESSQGFGRCENCERITLGLDSEVEKLKREKAKLIMETKELQRERDSILCELTDLSDRGRV